MTAPWHLGPIAGFDLCKLLVTSPEILVFLLFMITDPLAVLGARRGRPARRARAAGQDGATRDRAAAREGATGAWLAELWRRIDSARGGTIDVPTYEARQVRLHLARGSGQGPPIVVATLSGTTQTATYGTSRGAPLRRVRPEQVVRTFELASSRGRYLVADVRGAAETAPTAAVTASFRLTDVAPSVGLVFRQGSFRYGTDTGDVTAMMGGGLCWLDYDGDGWLDLYVVNSYSQADVPRWNAGGGLPQSRLYHNVHGRFVDVTAKTPTGLTVRGSGCVATDLDGNGTTDLLVTAASYDPQRNAYDALLWNNGDGTFTEGAKAAGIDQPGWHTGAAADDVNGDAARGACRVELHVFGEPPRGVRARRGDPRARARRAAAGRYYDPVAGLAADRLVNVR